MTRRGCTLSHRGPDATGSWLSPRAAFGHRRLIVIDPEGGTQPMVFRELRAELQSRGHRFRTHSDTEVPLHAYIEWEEACVHRFNGIFAFGLWDELLGAALYQPADARIPVVEGLIAAH